MIIICDLALISLNLIMTLLSPLQLSSGDRAAFATSVRLISCLVTESLVDAIFYPLNAHGLAGFAAIQFTGKVAGGLRSSGNNLAIVPLLHAPIFRRQTHASALPGPIIGLLDPLDVAPLILVFGDSGNEMPAVCNR